MARKSEVSFDGNFIVDCISFCYNSKHVCHLNLQKNDLPVEKLINEVLLRSDLTLHIYEAREHLKML